MAQCTLRRHAHALSLAFSALGTACVDTSRLRDLAALQSSIAAEFKEAAVSINLNNRVHLSVTFQNSSKADLPPDERAALARHVAVFVRDHYPGYANLASINIAFATRREGGPVNMTRTAMPYTFTPTDLGPARSDSASKVQRPAA